MCYDGVCHERGYWGAVKEPPSGQQAGLMHPTRMLSCFCSPDVLDENEASVGIEIFERDFKWNFVKS